MNESARLSWNRWGWLGGQVGGSCWMLIPILGASGIAAVYVLDSAGIYESIQVGGSVTAWETVAILIGVVVVLMIMFWWQDRQN